MSNITHPKFIRTYQETTELVDKNKAKIVMVKNGYVNVNHIIRVKNHDNPDYYCAYLDSNFHENEVAFISKDEFDIIIL